MRISATTLESFRLMRDTDYVSAEELDASIRGVYVPRREAKLGDALHRILREPERFRYVDPLMTVTYRYEDVTFPEHVILPCLEMFDHSGLWEVKATKDYPIYKGREPVRVVCKADQLVGARLIENKSKWSTFDSDRYAESYQWRFMADIFEPVSITYNVFCLSDLQHGIDFRSVEQFHLYPYPKLGADCWALLREFVNYVERRGLGSYLEKEAYGGTALFG